MLTAEERGKLADDAVSAAEAFRAALMERGAADGALLVAQTRSLAEALRMGAPRHAEMSREAVQTVITAERRLFQASMALESATIALRAQMDLVADAFTEVEA